MGEVANQTKMTDRDWKYPQPPILQEGLLPVDNGAHRIHYAIYGNPTGEPVMVVHGGPGGGSPEAYARYFDPKRYRIILFDQRGCGQSTPNIDSKNPAIESNPAKALYHNSTPYLVSDMEALRDHLGIAGKMHVFGGSWGSTLSMAYARAHPNNVQDLSLRGIFLCTRSELDFFYQGNATTYNKDKPPEEQDLSKPGAYRAYLSDGEYTIPKDMQTKEMKDAYATAWENFVEKIPKNERGDMVAAYHKRLSNFQLPREERLEYAQAWSVWEGITSNRIHDVSNLDRFKDPDFALTFATIENHYFMHGGFLEKTESRGQRDLLSDKTLKTLAQIPIAIVQGKYDQVCYPWAARELKKGLEDHGITYLDYREPPVGHSMGEKGNHDALVDFMNKWRPMTPDEKDSVLYTDPHQRRLAAQRVFAAEGEKQR